MEANKALANRLSQLREMPEANAFYHTDVQMDVARKQAAYQFLTNLYNAIWQAEEFGIREVILRDASGATTSVALDDINDGTAIVNVLSEMVYPKIHKMQMQVLAGLDDYAHGLLTPGSKDVEKDNALHKEVHQLITTPVTAPAPAAPVAVDRCPFLPDATTAPALVGKM